MSEGDSGERSAGPTKPAFTLNVEPDRPGAYGMLHVILGSLVIAPPCLVFGISLPCLPILVFILLVDDTVAPAIPPMILAGGILTLLVLLLIHVLLGPFLLLGNYLIWFLIRRSGTPTSGGHIVQFATVPSLYSGIRQTLDDANDIGVLQVTGDGVQFAGTHIDCFIPFSVITSTKIKSAGSRAMWFLSYNIELELKIDGKIGKVLFGERSAWNVIQAWTTSRQIFRQIVQQRSTAPAGVWIIDDVTDTIEPESTP